MLGASEYAKIKTRTAPKIGKIEELIAELTSFWKTMVSSGQENDLKFRKVQRWLWATLQVRRSGGTRYQERNWWFGIPPFQKINF